MKNRIKESEYDCLCCLSIPYEGVVEKENGEIFCVYCETWLVGHFENRHHMHYSTEVMAYEIPYHAADQTRVDGTNRDRTIQNQQIEAESSYKYEQVKRKVKDQLLKNIQSYYQFREFERRKRENPEDKVLTDPSQIKIDAPSPGKAYYQDQYAALKQKIENEKLDRNDLPAIMREEYSISESLKTYYACFDPKDDNYQQFWNLESPTRGSEWESMVPVWGNARMAAESLNRGLSGEGIGHYSHMVGYLCLGVADLILFGAGTADKIVKSTTAVNKPYFFQQYLKREQFKLNPRISNLNTTDIINKTGQYDLEHRATTLFSNDIIQTGQIRIRDYKSIYFQKKYWVKINGKPYNKHYTVSVNPWKRTIYHEGPVKNTK